MVGVTPETSSTRSFDPTGGHEIPCQRAIPDGRGSPIANERQEIGSMSDVRAEAEETARELLEKNVAIRAAVDHQEPKVRDRCVVVILTLLYRVPLDRP
jgi:hypothetical protein